MVRCLWHHSLQTLLTNTLDLELRFVCGGAGRACRHCQPLSVTCRHIEHSSGIWRHSNICISYLSACPEALRNIQPCQVFQYVRVFLESSAHLYMAMSRPDGLPLHGEHFDYNLNDTPTFAGDTERLHVAFASFQHADRDIALDPLSTNRRLQTDIPVLGTVIVTDPTPDTIQILISDCTIPPVGNDVRIELRHLTWAVNCPTRLRPLPHPEFSGPYTGGPTPSVLGGDQPAVGEMAQRE